MRDDFAKQLTERERIHSHDRHHNYRNVKGPKGLRDDEVGGRESMRKLYNHGYDRKSFNENLNPLKGWLRSCVGKKWDKCYSELRKKFDARKVVNNHILEHLYQYIEVNAYLDAKGRTVHLARYAWRAENRERPISESGSEFYVCPKDGTVKVTAKQPRRSVIKQREADKQKAIDAVCRLIDDTHALHLVDGVWYVYEIKDKPAKVLELRPPLNWENTWEKQRDWRKMSKAEREATGRWVSVTPAYLEIAPPPALPGHPHRLLITANQYYASRRQANHKVLRQHGLDGTAAANDECVRSHRDMGKYRVAA
jgi:hypothetical protein